MKTNFFEQVAGLQFIGNMLLNINHDETGILTVSAILKNGSNTAAAGNQLPPMLFKGTAQELDEGFFAGLAQPVKQTLGLLTNLAAYQQELDKAKKNAKPDNKQAKAAEPENEEEQEETETLFTPKPDDKEAKAEKKRLYDEAMDRAKELARQMKYAEALAQLPDATDYPDKAELLKAKRQEIQAGKDLYDKLAQQFND